METQGTRDARARGVTRRQTLRFGLQGAGAVMSSTALAQVLVACGGDDDDDAASGGGGLTRADVESAKGTIKILGWPFYEIDGLDPAGVTAKWAALTLNEDTVTKSKAAGSFDLTTIFTGMLDPLLSQKRIAEIDTSLLTNFDKIGAEFRDSDLVHRDGKLYAVPWLWTNAYITYDKRQTDEPKSLDDLMDPSLKGKIGLGNDSYAVPTTFARMLGFEDPNRLSRDQFDEVYDTLEKFKPQIRTIYEYGQAPGLLKSQDIAIAFPEFATTWVDAKDAGADAAKSLLGAWSYLDTLMLYEGAENPAAAYKWIDNAISVAQQKALAEAAVEFPVVDEAVSAAPEALTDGRTPEQVRADAPLVGGVPIDTDGEYVPFQEWTSRWAEFKA
jgi:putative spermidine/putrescine transport system substrate-binding protein